MKKKKYDTVVDEEWWKNMSTKKGLPKGHPFLDRENRPDGYGGKKTIDENTAIFIDPDNIFSVEGSGAVTIVREKEPESQK